MRPLTAFVLLSLSLSTVAQTGCGTQNNGVLCPSKQCCSQFGFCGTTSEFCLTSKRCQSQCIDDGPPPPPAGPPAPNIDPSKLYKPAAGTFGNKGLAAYWSNWAQYRGQDPSTPGCPKNSSFLPENINPNLYTHLNYAFVFMANNNTVVPHEYDDQDLSKRFNDWVHKVNPSCTTAFSVGGWTMTDGASQYTGGIDYSTFFSQMAASPAGRQTFIKSCIDWARTYGFDGVDMDWEYVGDPARGGGPADTENFTKLMQEMRAAFKAEASSSGKRELLITVAGPADPDKFALIQAKAVSEYIDWYNVMLYDFYGNWNDFVEVNAPIADTITPTWSFTSGIDMYINAGVPASKLYAGLPLYGRVWTLTDPSRTAPGSPGTAGTAGPCTAQPGYLGYFEIDNIRKALRSQNLENRALQFVPGNGYYLVFDNQWVGFDDVLSFQAKLEIVNNRGLAGTMLWAVDQDTPDMNLTKTLLDMYISCPKDGDWPSTAAGTTAEIDCPAKSIVSDAKQTRPCDSKGKWGSPKVGDCKGPLGDLMAAQQCVEGQ